MFVISVFTKATWIYATLYAEQDLHDFSYNDLCIIGDKASSLDVSNVKVTSPRQVNSTCISSNITHLLCRSLCEV